MSNAPVIEDFATAPGVTLQDSLNALGMSQSELAERTGISQKTINQIIKAEEPLTHRTALALEKVLRVPAHFWLKMESQYREHLARKEEKARMASYADWARQFPFAEMAKRGFVEATRKAEEKALALLSFFGVASPDQWQACYAEMHLELSYRKTAKAVDKLPALSAWLRKGERLASNTDTKEFSPEKFKKSLQEIRGFTTRTPDKFYPDMQRLCAEAGVIYHLVPELPGLGVSGVMRWFHSRPMIQQSLLFKTNDNFWFTFFHEAKHVLQARKKTIFLEGESADPEDTKREAEANRFAGDLLIPPAAWREFLVSHQSFTGACIKPFAKDLGIHHGIVTGRLLKEEHIHYSQPTAKLRDKFAWAS